MSAPSPSAIALRIGFERSVCEAATQAMRQAMITGANVGIGKEVARQLAQSGKYRKVYLGCRNPTKADLAQKDLERATGKPIFEVLAMEVSDPSSVRAALSSLREPVDDLVMNAGGSGGKTPLAKTKDGVTEIFAANVLGHVVLLDVLLKADNLKRAAVLVGSEAARGIPKFGVKRPTLTSSSVDEFASLCDGTYFRDRKADTRLAYGQVKYVGAMWMAATARRNPKLRLLTVSPGNTRGADGPRDLTTPLRIFVQYVAMPIIMPLFGLVLGNQTYQDNASGASLRVLKQFRCAQKELLPVRRWPHGTRRPHDELAPELPLQRLHEEAQGFDVHIDCFACMNSLSESMVFPGWPQLFT